MEYYSYVKYHHTLEKYNVTKIIAFTNNSSSLEVFHGKLMNTCATKIDKLIKPRKRKAALFKIFKQYQI